MALIKPPTISNRSDLLSNQVHHHPRPIKRIKESTTSMEDKDLGLTTINMATENKSRTVDVSKNAALESQLLHAAAALSIV